MHVLGVVVLSLINVVLRGKREGEYEEQVECFEEPKKAEDGSCSVFGILCTYVLTPGEPNQQPDGTFGYFPENKNVT